MESTTVLDTNEIAADILAEVKRLHERMDGYEKTISSLVIAMQGNPMLKALIPNGLKVW